MIAGRFKTLYRISPADAIIAVFTTDLNATLIHKDPEYDQLVDTVRQERLPLRSTGR